MAESGSLKKTGSQERTDLVAFWSVPLLDGMHTIEFEHGTTSGKRVLRVDGQEIYRKEWMFKLVGEEEFLLGNQGTKCILRVDPMPHFTFSYSLFVDGTPLEKFSEKQSQTIRIWAEVVGGKRYQIVFEKQTLNIYVNGELIQAENRFVDDGTEMRFELGTSIAVVKATSADKKQGVIHQLFVDDKLIIEDDFH